MTPKNYLSKAEEILSANQPELKKLIGNFLKTLSEVQAEMITLEVSPDRFSIYATAYPSEEETVDIFEAAAKPPLAGIDDLLATIPEPTTKEGFAELETLYDQIELSILNTLHSTWKEIKGKEFSKQAYAWITDAPQGMNLVTGKLQSLEEIGKTVDSFRPASQFENFEPDPQDEPLSDEERASLKTFFTEDIEWTDEAIEKEITALNQFCDPIFEDARSFVRKGLREIIDAGKAPADAMFVDFKLSISSTPSLRILGVPKTQKESEMFPYGIPVKLGAKNPLRKWGTVYLQISQVLCTSSFGQQIFNEISLDQKAKISLVISEVWSEMKYSSLPVFFRGDYDNQWHPPGRPRETLGFKEVKALAKKSSST